MPSAPSLSRHFDRYGYPSQEVMGGLFMTSPCKVPDPTTHGLSETEWNQVCGTWKWWENRGNLQNPVNYHEFLLFNCHLEHIQHLQTLKSWPDMDISTPPTWVDHPMTVWWTTQKKRQIFDWQDLPGFLIIWRIHNIPITFPWYPMISHPNLLGPGGPWWWRFWGWNSQVLTKTGPIVGPNPQHFVGVQQIDLGKSSG